MNQKMSIGNNEIFENLQKNGKLSNHIDGFETFMELPKEIGKGYRREIELRPGFELLLENYQFQESFVANVEAESSPWEFSACISGNIRCTLQGVRGDIDVDPGQFNVSFVSNPRGTIRYPVGQRLAFVSIRVESRLFSTFLNGQFDQIPLGLRGIADGFNGKFFYRAGKTTPFMKIAIHQILNCPYHGPIKRMYLESKAIELIVHQLVFDVNVHKKFPILRSGDIERIHEARDILIRDLQNPPTIAVLSRKVGLNEFKLKKGFHYVYGTSIYRYFLDHRFAHAKYLLEEGRMNISEAAYAIGYSRLDYFASSFKKYFGTTPKAYQLECQANNDRNQEHMYIVS